MSFKAGTYRIEELISAGLMEIGDGYRAKNSELSDQGIPFARAGNINDGFKFASADLFPVNSLSKVGSKLSRPGDVVFTSKGTVGRFALVRDQTQQFVYSPQLCFWRSLAPNRLLPEYLYYWMNSAEFFNQVAYLKGQTDMADYVSLRDQRRITATIPDTTTQRFIVDVVKPLDDRITLLRETNATLEAIAQALFKSWFVDFDPVHAKQQGRAPDGMDEATAALFPDSFEESKLGLMPKGWSISHIEEIAEKVGMGPFGSNIKVSTFVSQGVPVLNGRNVQDTLLTDLDFNFIIPSHAEKLKNSCVNAGDVVITHRGTLGQVALVPEGLRYDQFVVSQSQFFLRCDRRRMVPEWITYFLKSPIGQQLLLANTSQVGVPSIARPVSHLRSIKLVLPPFEILSRFSETVSVLHKSVVANRQQAQTLATLRDTLLPRLISGQLRLSEASSIS